MIVIPDKLYKMIFIPNDKTPLDYSNIDWRAFVTPPYCFVDRINGSWNFLLYVSKS